MTEEYLFRAIAMITDEAVKVYGPTTREERNKLLEYAENERVLFSCDAEIREEVAFSLRRLVYQVNELESRSAYSEGEAR